jgi:hypothetical protein
MLSSRAVVDVLLPFHNLNSLLIDAINSVLDSQAITLRIVLINDTCEELTLDDLAISRHSGHELIITPPGFKSGYGKSLDRAKAWLDSEYVGLMNSDDLVDPTKFNKQIQQLSAGNFDISITQMKRIDVRNRVSTSIFANSEPLEYSPFFLLLGSYGANATWTMRREIFCRLELDTKACLDWRLALANFSNLNIAYLPEPLYFYRRHSSQTTNSPLTGEQIQDVYIAWTQFALLNGVKLSTMSQFISLATPWGRFWKLDSQEILEGIYEVLRVTSGFPISSQIAIRRILERRMILSFMSMKGSMAARVRCSSLALRGMIPFLKDLIMR